MLMKKPSKYETLLVYLIGAVALFIVAGMAWDLLSGPDRTVLPDGWTIEELEELQESYERGQWEEDQLNSSPHCLRPDRC
jgi:hypothetical protein